MPAEAARASEPTTGPALLPRWEMLGCLTLPGRPEHVRTARSFVAGAIGAGCERADTALLLTSELVTNAVLHSRSRLPGGTVTIVVAESVAELLVTVSDNGSDGGVPELSAGDGAEHGNGLLLVDSLADDWGYQEGRIGTTVWFTLSSEPCLPDEFVGRARTLRGTSGKPAKPRFPSSGVHVAQHLTCIRLDMLPHSVT